MLWRALRGVDRGRYIEVGANDPMQILNEHGLLRNGLERDHGRADPAFAQLQREPPSATSSSRPPSRPRIATRIVFHVVDGTGLSTLDEAISRGPAPVRLRGPRPDGDDPANGFRAADAGWEGKDIHFMSVDTEGSEKRSPREHGSEHVAALGSCSSRPPSRSRTESTRHLWEHLVTGAGYQFCLFDGLSCFYVSEERREELGHALSYPACALDNYISLPQRRADARATRAEALAHERAQEIRVLVDEVVRWRGEAVEPMGRGHH